MNRYWLNKEDERPPIRYKTKGREHRAHKEFPDKLKQEKFIEVGKQCEICNKEFKRWKDAHYHHIMSLSYAFHYFPELPANILRSKENCQVICKECHTDIHKNDSLAVYSAIAQNLTLLLKTWKPPKKRYNKIKKNNRKRRNKVLWEKAYEQLKKDNNLKKIGL